MRMFVETIPSIVANVMREPFKNITKRCGLINDASGYESLYNAILNTKHICARILRDIEPENLLFIFGQTIQSIGYAPIGLPFPPPTFNEGKRISENGDYEQYNCNNEDKPKNRAVILCKLKYTDELEKFLIGKKQEGSYDTKRYEITWSELQKLEERLGHFGDHIGVPNVILTIRSSPSCTIYQALLTLCLHHAQHLKNNIQPKPARLQKTHLLGFF